MRYTLKDYQDGAARQMLSNFAKAREDFHRRGDNIAFSLSATTGAGKTVIAAAVIEALFFGGEEFDFAPDPTAVILWFTDDPALNEQTRFKLLDAGDQLKHSQLKVIETDFNQRKLEPGNVYFLNAQKLSKNSMLVRGDIGGGQEPLTGYKPMPDDRAYTMWDTIAETINDERLTLYLILDEAHRGMKQPTGNERAERSTIVKRLINGGGGVPPVPVVWGISATIERFTSAMQGAQGRTSYPAYEVSAELIQGSGLLKDDIVLDFPTESGDFDTVLLKRGIRKAKESTESWTEYLAAQNEPLDRVVPLVVVQLPNKPSDELLTAAIDTVFGTWPELQRDAIAHVFGDHKLLTVGDLEIPHISPERVQEASHIRVLLAKDAVSTGWDCPRAEVLVSFRPAKDQTHITQLLGRMVRTPLARRVEGNDPLNAVECVLPRFDQATATAVAEVLVGRRGDEESGGSGGGTGRRVLLEPKEFTANPTLPEAVWCAFDSLVSDSLPRTGARPTRRLLAFAQELSRDGLEKDARKKTIAELMAVLDGFVARYANEIEQISDGILAVEGETIVAKVDGGEGATTQFLEIADERVVESEYRVAKQAFTPDLARDFAERIAEPDGDDDGLFDAHLRVAALAKVEGIRDALDDEADKIFDKWLVKHRVEIKGLPDARRTRYAEVTAMSSGPESIEIRRPKFRMEGTKLEDGTNALTRPLHLLADETGEFPIGGLNEWETMVLDAELARPDALAWYRNPSRGSEDALTIAYQDEQGVWHRLCPDFIFFHGDEKEVNVSIVDPHGFHFADALPKLRGLASYAASESGEVFHRIEAIARIGEGEGRLRVLDLTNPDTRDEIENGGSAEALYLGDLANDYK